MMVLLLLLLLQLLLLLHEVLQALLLLHLDGRRRERELLLQMLLLQMLLLLRHRRRDHRRVRRFCRGLHGLHFHHLALMSCHVTSSHASSAVRPFLSRSLARSNPLTSYSWSFRRRLSILPQLLQVTSSIRG